MQKNIAKYFITRIAVALVCVVAAVFAVRWAAMQVRQLSAGSAVKDKSSVFLSATQIKSIRDIGQWELLCINDEEYVDTVRRRLIADDHLVRIYYGTLRLGLDLSDLNSDDVTAEIGRASCRERV